MEALLQISRYVILIMLLVIPLYAFIKRVPVFEVFVQGAAEGLGTAIRILPFLLGMLAAISVLRASGAFDFFVLCLRPITGLFGIPAEILPLALMRPLSGGGALGITADLINTFGPDSFIGRLASVTQGSTDTTLYILAVYFGSVNIVKYRYALFVGLAADCVSFLAAFLFCRWFFT
ncbi:MAG: spore maturation protein [Clostridiales bacterium]|nr:spore maturation protein [Clostridiales bacterium]